MRMMVILLIGLLLPSVSSAGTGELKQVLFTPEEKQFITDHPVIVVGGQEDRPPFDFVQEGAYTGLVKDYLDRLQEYTGITFRVQTGHSWDELLHLMNTRRIDLLPMLYWTERRTQYMRYTKPYLIARHYVFVRQGERTINSMQDLAKKRVAIPRGNAQIELLRQDYPEIRIYQVAGPLQAIDAVLTGRADALIDNTAMLSYLLKTSNVQGVVPAFAADLAVNKLFMAVRSDWPLLQGIIQKGLDSITDREKDAIAEKWIVTEAVSGVEEVGALPLLDEEQHYLQQKGVIKACVDPDWEPLEKIENGRYRGVGADYLALFEKKIGIPIEVVPTESWAYSVREARARRCDIFLLSVDSPERATFMDTTTPYLKLPLVIATRPDVLFISELDEIGSRKIGIVEGYALVDTVRAQYPELNLVLVSSTSVGMQMVANGELFGFLDTLSSIAFAIQKSYLGELKIGGRFGIDWELGVATRNDEPLLGRIFERVVRSLDEETKQEILNRWTAVNYTSRFDYTLLWQVIGIFSIVLLFFVYRNRELVKHRQEIYGKNIELAEINQRLAEQNVRIEYLAKHDSLTGLPNRQNFIWELEHAISISHRNHQKLAILFIDLDRFKSINDTLGHPIGDEVLKEVSSRMNRELRDSDTLVRVGGDEFIILMEAISADDQPAIVAKKIQKALKEPIQIKGYSLSTTASIGIAIYPDDAPDSITLIKNADSAMYSAKDEGKDTYRYFTKKLSELIHRRLFIENALRHAIERNELSLRFQPQLALDSGHILGAEALLRWIHPQLGRVSPDEFIPIAEDSGLIVKIGEWVFAKACQAFIEWRDAGCGLERLSINVSSVQFGHGDIAATFKHIIKQQGIAANHIEIEITERYIMEHTEQNTNILESLRRIGFRISVDDFGTGYSSMSYLKTLPLDTIKIDKAFIDDIPHDINDVEITRAILALSHSLGYTVVAEGIETEQQLQFLKEAGCNFGQGYLFSRPLSSKALMRYVSDQQMAKISSR